MQSDNKELYKITARRTGKSEQKYKDVGNFVFSALYSNLRRPKSLIVKLKGVGYWYLRKARIEAIVNLFPPVHHPKFDLPPTTRKERMDLIRYEARKEVYEILKERIKDYEKYIQIRDEIRKKRYETQRVIQPSDREDISS
jgi:hypothetical protein